MDGAKAIEMAQQHLPDLILLDAIMPGMDGYAVCAALRAAPQLSDIPIIFVTALCQPEDETRALEAGAADFISKPFNIAVVRARVRTQLTVKRQADAMRELTMTDALTGVANRRNFNDTMAVEWRRCGRLLLPLSVIMIDIDHFKQYNDHYGHQAGDDCLQQIAAAMKRCAARPQDLLARYGGEEFILLLPQEGPEGAEVVAQRMMAEVRRLALPHALSPSAPHVTVSMGLASVIPPEGLSPDSLIRSADSLLYRAKHSGRNRYCASLDDPNPGSNPGSGRAT
jgi:diguanylate cyclase (GGDEF)-like protein